MIDAPTTQGIKRLDLADPRQLASLEDLDLVARGVVEGFLVGLHRSPYRGASVEFAENRPYAAGDDVRFMDWKVYARSDRLFIKQFEEETNLRAYLLLDVSRSMEWSSDTARLVEKLDYGRLLAASLARLLIRQGDAVGLVTFDDGIRSELRPRSSRAQWSRVVKELTAVSAGGRTDASGALREVAGRLRRRGLVVLISDLLVEPAATRTALHALRHRGHEALVLQLVDPGERELPAAGEAVFFDPETGEELMVSSAALRRDYREAVERSLAGWRRAAAAIGAEHAVIGTERPLGLALRAVLRRRRRAP